MLPLVVNDARAVTIHVRPVEERYTSLDQEWYPPVPRLESDGPRHLSRDEVRHLHHAPPEEREAIDRDARRFARAMKAPVVFTSSTESINVLKLFKVILARSFGLNCTIPQLTEVGEPLLIF